MPARAIRWIGCPFRTSSPACMKYEIEPRAGSLPSVRTFSSVDLPAPFGPTMQSSSPALISKSTPRSTSSAP